MTSTLEADDASTLEQMLEQSHEDRENEIHTSMPVRVERYDESADVVDLKVMARRAVPDDAGGYQMEDFPILRSVRIEWPGAGDWFIRWPLATGSTGKADMCERDFTRWAQTGAVGDPIDFNNHSLSFATFRPGLRPRTDSLSGLSPNGMTIGKRGGATITVRDDGFVDVAGAGATLGGLAGIDDHLAAIASSLDEIRTAIALGTPTPDPHYGAVARAALLVLKPTKATKARLL